jgi:hypothetical protein
VDCITLAMMAASLWIAYNGLYMQMCSYRDGQVSDDAALPYSTVLRFIRVSLEMQALYKQLSGELHGVVCACSMSVMKAAHM